MTVESILPYLNENRNVIIRYDGEEIARYDGRNSIPHICDDRKVVEINIEDGAFVIDIA